MELSALSIRKIAQIDNTTFEIVWSDDKVYHYTLSELQRQCPCASCRGSDSEISDNLRARKVRSVGRYAIRIDFSSGCSSGIFDYDLLRSIGEER